MQWTPFPSDPYIELSRHTRDIVREATTKNVTGGDAHLHLVEGETLLGPSDSDDLAGDGVHPNELGHSRIAQRLQPTIEQALQAAEDPDGE